MISLHVIPEVHLTGVIRQAVHVAHDSEMYVIFEFSLDFRYLYVLFCD